MMNEHPRYYMTEPVTDERTDEQWAADEGVLAPPPSDDDYVQWLTNERGVWIGPADMGQPLPGSVVMTDGIHGTAWQRRFFDLLWHPTEEGVTRSRTWRQIKQRRNLHLIYAAPVRHTATRPSHNGFGTPL